MNAQPALAIALSEAARLHDAGEHDAARDGYREVLANDPRNTRAHYLLALLERVAGNLAQSLAGLQRSIELDPAQADVWLAIGEAHSAAAEDAKAIEAFEQCVSHARASAMGWFKLAFARQRSGQLADAEKGYRRAVRLQPLFPEAWCNLGNVLRDGGRYDEATVALRRATAQRPCFAEAWHNLGVVHEAASGRREEALECFERACIENPGFAEAHFSRGAALAVLGRVVEAVGAYEQVFELAPAHAGAYNNLGIIYFEQWLLDEARICFGRAASADPMHAKAHNNLGNVDLREQRYEAAGAHFERALRLDPDFPEALIGAGVAAQEMGGVDVAIHCFDRAIAVSPENAQAHANLGIARGLIGAVAEGRTLLSRAAEMTGSAILKIRAATIVPPIMGTPECLREEQAGMYAALAEVAALPDAVLRTSESELLEYITPLFYAAFRGWNNRQLMSDLAHLYCRMTPSLAQVAPHVGEPRRAGPVRVGFISSYFFRHSVGISFAGLLAGLADDPRLELIGISLGSVTDEVSAAIRSSCAQWVEPRGTLGAIRDALVSLDLDVLFYTDIGMDRVTYPLAMARLARVQCIGGGHPETCGIPTIDYVVSSRLIEDEDAQPFHTEQLVLLDALPSALSRPVARDDICTRAELGLAQWPQDRFYVCPAKLQKLHPDFDLALAAIIRRDPRARIILFCDDKHQHWRSLTEDRQRQTMGDAAARVSFMPWADARTFQSWLRQADVVLDCWPFGLGTTAITAVGLGIPIVTLPAARMTTRTTRALMHLAEVYYPVASSVDEYVEKAVALASDVALRQQVSGALAASTDRIFCRADSARATGDFLVNILQTETP